ncbi:MAG TPA: long-chain fatty acid--CoA ligase [Acidobacteriaceae bacterium]|nr:long-chain fatty acid--CoA ligase [Acidobacteriaceae bacterium]
MAEELQTLNDVLALATGRGEQTVMLWQDKAGAWLPISSNELRRRVRGLAGALKLWGIQKGDRIAILSENRWEWAVTDFAALAIGAVDVPLYPTLTAEQAAYALRDSGARMAVVSTSSQLQKIASILSQTSVERILVMDSDPQAWNDGPSWEKASPLADFMGGLLAHEDEAAFSAMLREAKPDDLATIIYTSGTTGESKGVMLTHANIASNLNYSTSPFNFNANDVCISFLPLSHITARHLDYALLYRGAVLAYVPEVGRLIKAMQEVKPTVFVAVPRVYEKVRQSVEQKSAAGSDRKRKIFAWAVKTGHKHRGEILRGLNPASSYFLVVVIVLATLGSSVIARGEHEPWREAGLGVAFLFFLLVAIRQTQWVLANKLVFSRIREAFGGRVKHFISGGAPLGMDTAGWYADMGIRIHEGYGLTETSPVIALNYPLAHKIGTVGRPLPNVECRLAADGELEVRGPSIFKGYWQKPEQTAESFTEDGWFKTGDIGAIDAEGYLSITDRKKELIKTSNGKFIAPQPIEGSLKGDLLVGQVALVGDKQKFVSALISPNFAALSDWAKRQGIESDVATPEGRAALIQQPQVKSAYKEIVDRVNAHLAPYELIKKHTIVPDEWSLETGELTPSLKLKRRVIQQNYAALIDGFYGD